MQNRALTAAEQEDSKALEDVADYLKVAMKEDEEFATQVRQIAQEIVNIGKIEGRNVQNNYGGQNLQVNDPQAPTIQAGSNNTFNFNYGRD